MIGNKGKTNTDASDRNQCQHVTVQSIFGDERNIAAEVMISGTQRKDLVYGQVRIPSQGKHYELPHVFLLQANESGLITEVAAYWDNASFYSQLGKKNAGLNPTAGRVPRGDRAADSGSATEWFNHNRRFSSF